jgi:hypothetical protein
MASAHPVRQQLDLGLNGPLQGIQIERLEFLGVIELLAHRIRLRRLLVESLQVQLIRPPMLVRRGPNRRVSVRSAQYRALAFSRHIFPNRLLNFFNHST